VEETKRKRERDESVSLSLMSRGTIFGPFEEGNGGGKGDNHPCHFPKPKGGGGKKEKEGGGKENKKVRFLCEGRGGKGLTVGKSREEKKGKTP